MPPAWRCSRSIDQRNKSSPLRGKSETRNPKEIQNLKSEIQDPPAFVLGFEFRILGFFRISDFGFIILLVR
jgi:hypothetical protein